jgi:hypothetical protein
VSLSQSNTPAPHSSAAAAQQPPPAVSTDDYFGGQSSGADDWLAVAAPPAAQAPMHMPTSTAQTHGLPPQQSPYGVNPYATPGMPQQPSQAHLPPAHLSAHTPHAQHLQPPVPVDRQLSQLAEIDLNSPARPAALAHASSDLADVPLTTPQAGVGASSYAQQTPHQQQTSTSAYGEPPRSHPPPSFAPTMPGVMNPYASGSAAAASSPANGIGAPAASPYGVQSGGAAPFRPPMPSPMGANAAMPEPNGRAPPTTFQPRSDPAAVVPQQSPMQPQHPTPWQPQPQAAPQQNGHAAAPMQQPYTPQHQQIAYGQQPNGTPQNAAFAAPGALFSSPTSPLGAGTRPWAPPPAHPLVCFGFGGRLLTMLPRAGHDGAMRAGTVKLEPLTDLLDHTPFVSKLTSFPGPLTLPPGQPGTRHPRHVELEDMVQVQADKAMYDALPGDSPLAELVKKAPQRQQEVAGNHRTAKRLLHLLLLEALRHSGRIHRASNPTSPHTLPAAPAGQVGSVEEAIVQYLVQLDGQGGGGRKDGQWLDNAASSHAGGGDGVIPSPVKSPPSSTGSADASKNDDGVVVAMQGLLMKGQRKEACNLAIEHQLWSHALLLASFDMATYHMVVGRFATQQFADGSPLQSLYLLFAQQPNLLFRGVAGPDGKGMDGLVIPGPHTPLFTQPNTPPLLRNWRANLSMLLANPTPNDKQVLTTLGDTLWQNYHLPAAAHMVYVLAGHSLGPDLPGSAIQHAQPLGRILLLGADHRKHMRTFVTPGALQRTEIFEYTRQLAATSAPAVASAAAPGGQAANVPMLPYGGLSPAFQLFKLLYAYQLAEVGLLPRALQYCEQLSTTVALHGKTGKGSLVFPLVFLTGLTELEGRLRECLSKKAGPGLASKIGGKLLGWLVGDSAQAPGATTVVGPDPTLASSNPIARSVSTNNIPQQRNVPQMTNNAQPPPLHNSASELNLNQQHHQQQQHHQSGAASADYNNFSSPSSSGLSSSAAASTAKDLSIQPPPKHSRTRTEPAPDSGSSKSTEKPAEEATPGGTRKQSGLFGKITSLWGGGGGTDGKKKPVKAHLRQENTFEYDDASGKWVQRDAKGNIVVDEEEEKPVAPPTISEEMKARLSAPPPMPTAGSPSAGGGPATPGPSMPGMPPPSSMFAQRGAAGAKGRYALADNSFEDASASASMVAAPVAAPMPGMFPLPNAGGAGAPPAAGGFPSPMPGAPPAAGGAPQFKLFRPSAAPMPGMDGSPAPVASPYGAPQPQQQAHQPYGTSSMGRASTPPQARPDLQQPAPPQQQHPPSHPPQYASPYGQPAGGYQPHGMPSYDGRAQSTPPMRPGTVPAGGPSMPHMNPLGAPAAGHHPMMRYQPIMPGAPQMPGMPPQPQPGAPYNPAGYRQPPPAQY